MLIDVFDHPFFTIVGGFATLFSIVVFVITVIAWLRGILRVWWRLGLALSRRKIAIFAEDEFDNLRNILVDSKLFQETNIRKIDRSSIKRAEGWTLLLVHWRAFENEMDEILRLKKDACALIVYAPPHEGKLPEDLMAKINNERNSILVNFRGRLLNDILICMITTKFEETWA